MISNSFWEYLGSSPRTANASLASLAYSYPPQYSGRRFNHDIVALARTLNCNFSSLPRLVVTNTTPLAPRTPYIAVAEASFNTEKLSTSAGSTSFRLPSNPSINTNAPELYPNVPIPRTQNSDIFFPGSPLDCIEMIPATRPPKALAKLVAGNCKLATSTEVTAPVADILRVFAPKASTTTSCSISASGFIFINKFFSAFKARYSIVEYPIKVNCNLSPRSVFKVKCPSTLAIVPTPGLSFT